jgi:hypothetical protein
MSLLDQTIFPIEEQYVRYVYGFGHEDTEENEPVSLSKAENARLWYWQNREALLEKKRLASAVYRAKNRELVLARKREARRKKRMLDV